MLLSMFLSFFLKRKFGSRIYVGLVTILIIVVSFLSMGFPVFYKKYEKYELKHPLPLSFPFYAYIESPEITVGIYPPPRIYILYFLTFEISSSATPFSIEELGELFLYYSFFLLVNIVGAIIGYWIGKSTILERLFKT